MSDLWSGKPGSQGPSDPADGAAAPEDGLWSGRAAAQDGAPGAASDRVGRRSRRRGRGSGRGGGISPRTRTTARVLTQGLRARGLSAEMIYTGQTGWLQGGRYGFILMPRPMTMSAVNWNTPSCAAPMNWAPM